MASQHSAIPNLRTLQVLLGDESGQNLVEYGLVVGLIGLALVVSTTSMASSLKNAFSSMSSALAARV